eukprot:CAMPEP_0119514718 /NCGR_PEP_ID=MMETSP1344-20130328/32450_1 /TAXON_ID=236787 /ORGANISM="Florenciella parvula, Strain CCMP2471" /LENGTH=489 /DNA_ID=CAMNT_0007552057 /DNA_START=59 /DNA_END=1528 /DNA_ORIENTATION=+
MAGDEEENQGLMTGEPATPLAAQAAPRVRMQDIGTAVGMLALCVVGGTAVVLKTADSDGAPSAEGKAPASAFAALLPQAQESKAAAASHKSPDEGSGGDGATRSGTGMDGGVYDKGGKQSLQERKSLCIDGHIAPTFVMPGCQKCGTTSFYEDMYSYMIDTKTGTLADGDALNTTGTSYYSEIKEKHFYEHIGEEYPALGGELNYIDYWNLYPECDGAGAKYNTGDNYIISTDFTPNYMFEDEVPGLMKDAYGGASDRINIFMILREPIARVQSYYYADMGTDLESYTSFETYIETQLNISANCTGGPAGHLDEPHADWPPCVSVYTNSITQSMYGDQLEYWLQYFKPEQFYIVPYTSYVNDPDSTLKQTAEVLGLKMTDDVEAASWTNVGSHNSIGEDLHPELLDKLVKYFEASNQKVYDLIDEYKLTVVPGNDAVKWAGFLDYNTTSNAFPYGGTYGGHVVGSNGPDGPNGVGRMLGRKPGFHREVV